MIRLLVLWAFAALANQEKAPEDLIPPPSWSDWQDFGPGSTATLQVETGGKKIRMFVALKEKTADRMTLEEVVEADGKRQPPRERVVPKGNPGVYDLSGSGDCPKCRKPLKDHKERESKKSAENMKILQAEVACKTYTTVDFDCEGKEAIRRKYTYSEGVPGELVRLEFKDKTREYKITCVAFEKK